MQAMKLSFGSCWAMSGFWNRRFVVVLVSFMLAICSDAASTNRILAGEKCTNADIVVSQGATRPLPNGIPTYTVEITNACASGCDISDIHLSCGWFSSARLINPDIFKRIAYNDCLVNGGNALKHGATLSFQYATTFSYQLSVSSLTC